MTMPRNTILFCSTLALGAGSAAAQTPGAVDQLDTLNKRQETQAQNGKGTSPTSQSPQFYEGETEDVGPQLIYKAVPRRKYFQATADSQYFYTSNMFFDEKNEEDAPVWVNSVQLAL